MSRSLKNLVLLNLIASGICLAQVIDRYVFSKVFERVKESVVTIEASSTIVVNNSLKDSEGLGSGVIVDTDGNIVTNKHVVENAREIFVVFQSGQRLKATLSKNVPPDADLALVKLDVVPPSLTPIKMGDSDKLVPGEMVLAVGSPFGFGGTLTGGIVSAIRHISSNPNDPPPPFALIQTDAAINPGNSGGALVNLDGELVGINTFIFSSSGANAGLGFAIPVNVVRQVVGDIKTNRIPGSMGITVQDINQQIVNTFKLGILRGVLVTSVVANGPGQQAGLRQGDLIVGISRVGKSYVEIKNSREFKWIERNFSSGDSVELSIIKLGKNESQIVTVILK
ncbi:MAG TPA: trypsin-like peptidase domain-containing protein [Candidatus Paceibacterota bacterium]